MSQFPFGFGVLSDGSAGRIDHDAAVWPQSQFPFGFGVLSDSGRCPTRLCGGSADESQFPFGFGVLSDPHRARTQPQQQRRRSQFPFGFGVLSDTGASTSKKWTGQSGGLNSLSGLASFRTEAHSVTMGSIIYWTRLNSLSGLASFRTPRDTSPIRGSLTRESQFPFGFGVLSDPAQWKRPCWHGSAPTSQFPFGFGVLSDLTLKVEETEADGSKVSIPFRVWRPFGQPDRRRRSERRADGVSQFPFGFGVLSDLAKKMCQAALKVSGRLNSLSGLASFRTWRKGQPCKS